MSFSPSILTISNAEKLGFKSRFELFGGSIAFKRVSEWTLSVVYSNITNAQGQMLDFAQIEALKNTEDYNDFSVNGTRLRRAKLKSFELASANFNKSATINIVLETQDAAENLKTMTGYYADLAAGFVKSASSFVDEISESTSVSRDENSLNFSKQVDIKFSNSFSLTGSLTENPVVKTAQKFVSGIFAYDAANHYLTVPDTNSDAQLRGLLTGTYKKYTTETINTVTNQCSFAQNLSAENIPSYNSTYSHSASQSVNIAQNGIVTVTEDGKIQGLVSPLYTTAETAYGIEYVRATGRMNAIFTGYYDCGSMLNSTGEGIGIKFLTASKTIDQYAGTISYNLTASNDPKYETIGAANVFYANTITYSVDNDIYTASEKGTIESLTKTIFNGSQQGINRFPKFKNAYNFYNTISPATIKGRIDTFMGTYVGNWGDVCSHYPISRNDSYSLLKGTIQYERVYSTDLKYRSNDVYKSKAISSSTDYEFTKKNEFRILNHPIVIQGTAGNEKGTQQISAKILAYRIDPNQGITKLNEMLGVVAPLITAKKISNTNFLESANLSYSYMNDVNFDLSTSYSRGMDAP